MYLKRSAQEKPERRVSSCSAECRAGRKGGAAAEGMAAEKRMNKYYIMGMVCGVFVGLLLVAVLLKVTKTDGRMKCRYDERQTEARGKGYKYGFFTFLIGDFLYALLCAAEFEVPAEPAAVMMILIVLGMVVQIVYCIWKDAYFSLNENRTRVLVAFAVVAGFNLLLGVFRLLEGDVVVNGVLTFNSMNLLCGILFLIIFFAMLLKRLRGTSDGEE